MKEKYYIEKALFFSFFPPDNPALPPGMINEFNQTASFSVLSQLQFLQTTQN